MQFSTPIPIAKSSTPIDYNSKMVLLGSCFAQNMGQKFTYFKFQNQTNPFGVIFNPVSLKTIIEKTVTKNYFTQEDIFLHHNLWHSFVVHSQLSGISASSFLDNANQLIATTHQNLLTATHVLITLGTSWVYKHIATQQIVANCHKVPQNEFDKVLLSVTDIEQNLKDIIYFIQSINSNCKFIFTISPVRHIKDGFFENNVSKGNIFSALQKLKKQDYGWGIEYFPSYEIVLDELRDYRFYEKDMLHPNQQAVDYIWERFSQTYFNVDTLSVIQEVDTIQKGLAHRPFNPDTQSHLVFLQKLHKKSNTLALQYPSIKF